MNAIEALREQVRVKEEARVERGREKEAQLIAEMRERWVAELSEEVLEELGAELGVGTVRLHYRGREYTGLYPKGARVKVLDWIEKVDRWHEKREKERVLIVPKLEECQSDYEIRQLERREIKKYQLMDFEDVRRVLEAARARIAEREAEETRRGVEEREERRKMLLNKVRAAASWAEWREIQDTGLRIRKFLSDDEFGQALEELEKRLVAADEEREALREQAESKVFWPFRYYKVTYGVIAEDEDAGGERYVDTVVFCSLSDGPGKDGWWVTVGGNMIRPVHVVMVEMEPVLVAEDLPYWCPRRDTKWGEIRVPPENAERV